MNKGVVTQKSNRETVEAKLKGDINRCKNLFIHIALVYAIALPLVLVLMVMRYYISIAQGLDYFMVGFALGELLSILGCYICIIKIISRIRYIKYRKNILKKRMIRKKMFKTFLMVSKIS